MKKKPPTASTQINKVNRCLRSGGPKLVKQFLSQVSPQAGVREHAQAVIEKFEAREPKSRFKV